MPELLQEFVTCLAAPVRVDRQTAVVRGVKIIGLASRNRRRYLPEALSAAAGLYEGAKVNVNHPKGSPLAPRDYQDRIGTIRNVQFRGGEGLFGDFHFNPRHTLAEQLVWDAEHAPQNVGFSHNVVARTLRRGDETVVEQITQVQSVDLVADPAATRGLFEQVRLAAESDRCEIGAEPAADTAPPGAQQREHARCAAASSAASSAPADATCSAASSAPTDAASGAVSTAKGAGASAVMSTAAPSAEAPGIAALEDAPASESGESLTLESLCRRRPDLAAAIREEAAGQIAALRAEVERLRAEQAERQRRQHVQSLLEEFGLSAADTVAESAAAPPDAIVSPTFLSQLLAAGDESVQRALVEDRARLVASICRGSARMPGDVPGAVPRVSAREQRYTDRSPPRDTRSFVRALRGQ